MSYKSISWVYVIPKDELYTKIGNKQYVLKGASRYLSTIKSAPDVAITFFVSEYYANKRA